MFPNRFTDNKLCPQNIDSCTVCLIFGWIGYKITLKLLLGEENSKYLGSIKLVKEMRFEARPDVVQSNLLVLGDIFIHHQISSLCFMWFRDQIKVRFSQLSKQLFCSNHWFLWRYWCLLSNKHSFLGGWPALFFATGGRRLVHSPNCCLLAGFDAFVL